MGLKEFCVLLLAGGMGAGSVVAVQKVKAPERREARAPKAARPAARPAAARPRPKLPDCPVIVAPLGHGLLPDMPNVTALGRPLPPSLPGTGQPPLVVPDDPGPGTLIGPVIAPRPIPTPPVTGAIPEAATWAMMVSGFGLIGLALRRRSPGETAPVTEN